MHEKIRGYKLKVFPSDLWSRSQYFNVFLPLYVLASEVAIVKSHLDILLNMPSIPGYWAYRPVPWFKPPADEHLTFVELTLDVASPTLGHVTFDRARVDAGVVGICDAVRFGVGVLVVAARVALQFLAQNWKERDSFIYLFGALRRFQHCTGHITTGSWKGGGNQYIQFIRVLYCKLPTNGKQLPAFPLEAVLGIEPQPQRWEVRVLPLCHRGPWKERDRRNSRERTRRVQASTRGKQW